MKRDSGATVRDIMTTNVASVSVDTTVARIAQLMESKAISGLPVVDSDRRVIGIVTDRDLIVRLTRIESPAFLPLLEGRIPLETQSHFEKRIQHMVGNEARDVMTADVMTIGPDQTVEALAEMMVKKHVNLVPVVLDGQLLGVVSRSDIVRWMTRDVGPSENRA